MILSPLLLNFYTNSLVSYSVVVVYSLGATLNWAWIRKVKNSSEELYINWLVDEMMLSAKLSMSRIIIFNYKLKWFLGASKQRRYLYAL